MKRYLTLLLVVFSFFEVSQTLFAQEIQHLTYSWSGDEENLNVHVNSKDGLEFSKTYAIAKTLDEKGQMCEIICEPIVKGSILSSEGYELQKIVFTVFLHNTDNPDEVAFTIVTRSLYETVSRDGYLTVCTSESKREGTLDNPPINMSQDPDPVFFIDDDNIIDEVAISFKNL